MTSSYSCEMRPRMLKDFLSDDYPSCSTRDLHSRLLRSRSKSAAISISAIHKASEAVIKAIKFFPFAGSIVKSRAPSLLPRSISRKKSRRESSKRVVLGDPAAADDDEQQVVTPKIKDILRWKSFRDVVEELSTTWLESDFTPEDLNSLGNVDHGESYYFMDKKNKMEDCFSFDENDQQSPVSVLNDSPFRDDREAEPVLFCNGTVATMERRKSVLMQRIAEFEALAKLDPFTHEEEKPTRKEANSIVEAKARQLLNNVIETKNSVIDVDNAVLLDFFRHEIMANLALEKQKEVEFSELEMRKMAEAWMSREDCGGTFDSEVLDNKESCLKEMETGPMAMRWRKNDQFEEEQKELGCDLEIQVFNDLLDELWADLKI